MAILSDYELFDCIYKSTNSAIHRGQRLSDSEACILKVLNHDRPEPEALARFEQEFDITQQLDLAGVIKVSDLKRFGNSLAIVLEDFGGESLDRFLKEGPLDLEQFFTIAISLSNTLGNIHSQRVIHKDINPSNIVWNPQTGVIKIIDFGLSTTLSQEAPEAREANRLAGTLPYIAPEQTGRMNRNIDYRADFYSLGITFYHLLTGQPPFNSQDPLELVHSHIARTAQKVHERQSGVPLMLSAIIEKLMAKDAESRYQSAVGLQSDLIQCQHQWQKGDTSLFTLVRNDHSDRFQIPQKLYGRDQEVQTLLDTFERVIDGAREMMLVAGYSGVGKSALIHELHKPITARRGYFISGKYDQYQRDIPYAALIQAFSELVQQLLSESELKLANWKERFLKGMGKNAGVIIDVIPELEAIVGSQPPLPDLPPTEASNRFNLVFRNFVTACVDETHPLTMFLDDLQWSDGPSRELIQQIMTDQENGYLFLVGAYRDNEVAIDHPLMRTIEAIEKNGSIIHTLTLSPLNKENVVTLVSDTLICHPDKSEPFAELCFFKTHGNPFFLNQFLHSLYERKHILFSDNHWHWDMQAIQNSGITDNVVDLMATKISNLPEETSQLVQLAACIGNVFDLNTLALVNGKNNKETMVILWKAMQEGLILPLDEGYQLARYMEEANPAFRFIHDRVQQAAYGLIGEEQKEKKHLEIGNLLVAGTPPKEWEEKIFDIVGHLNLGRHLITDQKAIIELAKYNLTAGHKAKRSTAFETALIYFQAGLDLLEPSNWKSHYDLTLELHLTTMEFSSLVTDYKAMEKLSAIVEENAIVPLDRVRAMEIIILAYLGQNRLMESIEQGLLALSLLGFTFPDNPTSNDIDEIINHSRQLFSEIEDDDIINLPEMSNPEKLMVMKLLTILYSPAYLTSPILMPLIGGMSFQLSLKYGIAPSSASSFASFGIIMCGIAQDFETGSRFGYLALRLANKSDTNQYKARAIHYTGGLVTFWKEHLRKSLRLMADGLEIGLDSGEFDIVGHAAIGWSWYAAYVGDPLEETQSQVAVFSASIFRTQRLHVIEAQRSVQQFISYLIGPSKKPHSSVDQTWEYETALQRSLEQNNLQTVFIIHKNIMILSYLFGNYTQATKQAILTDKYQDASPSTYGIPLFHLYDSLIRLTDFTLKDEESRQIHLERVAANQKIMKGFAEHAPMNFLNKFHLVEAERERVAGNFSAARDHYELAIQLAHEHGFLNEEALALELAGAFYHKQKSDRLARHYLQDAHHAYSRWQAWAKVADLEVRYPEYLAKTKQAINRTIDCTTSNSIDGGSAAQFLDLPTVLKASQAISGEIDFKKLLTSLMSILLKNAGAEQGSLVLIKEGVPYLAATGSTEQDSIRLLDSLPLQEADKNVVPLAVEITNLVIRSREACIIDDAVTDNRFAATPYIRLQRPKSILCAPLIHQGQIFGAIYLENNLSTGAFPKERLELVQLLGAQAAISITNSRAVALREERQRLRMEQEFLKKETNALREAKNVAEMANKAKSRFLATVSHDLRQPLMAEGLLINALDNMSKSSDVTDVVENLKTANQSFGKMFDTLMDYSKLDAGVITAHLSSIALGPLFKRLKIEFSVLAKARNLQFRVINTNAIVQSDPTLLERVIRNLLTNAIRYTKTGGVVLGVRKQSDKIRIEVWDTGVGISTEDQKEIFHEFHQLDNRDKHQEIGLGLGLAIVHGLCSLLKHKVDVVSHPGHGSRFSVTVPADTKTVLATDKYELSLSSATTPPVNLAGQSFLLVDDDESVREGLQATLTGWGCQCVAFESGSAAIAWINEKKEPSFDLILCDYRLHGGELGTEVLKNISNFYPDPPLGIIITGETKMEVLSAIEQQGYSVLVKPISPLKLRTLLRNILRQKRPDYNV
ncbi:MAG: AAA family ATPase [Magnetococcales bacterium]|nr:AAA family ATPase [Magnetococcales bacterium]